MAHSEDPEREELSLSKAAQNLLEECRMVLPGIQALFGFQLVAFFNTGFSSSLTEGQKRLHLGATLLTCCAVALVMTPAAYHRQALPRAVTGQFLRVSTRLLVGSMFPLAASICLDLYLVAYVTVGRAWVAVVSAVLFVLFMSLWFGLPMALRRPRPRAG